MSDITGAQQSAEANPSSSGTPGAPAPEGTAAPDAATGQQAEAPPPPTPEEIAKLRNEAAALRRQLSAYQRAEEERRRAQMTEAERIAAEKQRIEEEKAALARERQTFALRQAALAAAGRAGAVYPDIIDAILVARIGDVQFDDSGVPQNVDALVAELRRTHPLLFRSPAGTADGGAGGVGRPTSPSAGMNAFIRRAAGRT